jgi:hypothetical protein
MPKIFIAHRGCTLILPSLSATELPKDAPRWMRERTHGCWCSGWRATTRGLRIWRRGGWRKPEPGEVRRVKKPWLYELQHAFEGVL